MTEEEKFGFYQDVEDHSEPLPTKEKDSYTGPIIDYPYKHLWFETRALGGHYTPYQIVRGNGDWTFDIDAFINSELGRLVIEKARYELSGPGMMNHAGEFMVNYWKYRNIVLNVYDAEEKEHEWLVYAPDYVWFEENKTKKYPVMFSCHGGGGTLFEATNHGFVDIAYEKGMIVVCPECENMNRACVQELFPQYIDRMEAMGYPLDRSRIYMSGMSNGAGATVYTSVRMCKFIAAGAAHSSPGSFDTTDSAKLTPPEFTGKIRMKGAPMSRLSQADLDSCNGVPLYFHVGTSDVKNLPFEQPRIDGFNLYFKTLGLHGKMRATSSNILGITADKIFTQQIDSTEYTFAKYYNDKGEETLTIVGIEGLPHWVSPSFARLAWDFVSRYSINEKGDRVCID